jgi:isoleucyl-tRNA synthetase
MDFFDNDVSKWYVRLSRARFYDVDADDNRAAFATLHEVLAVTTRLLAPFAPFVTDWMHRELTGASVHLADYVRASRRDAAPDLEAAMEAVRRLATLGRAAREEVGINVRQPLGELVCVVPDHGATPGAGAPPALLRELEPVLAAELNVKAVRWAESGDSLVTLEAKPNFRILGKRFGKSMPLAQAAVEALESEALRAFERGQAVGIEVDGATHLLEPGDLTILRRASGAYVVEEDGGFVAALDPTVTPALRREGLAREVISRVQRMRKEAGLAVSDRIRLAVAGDAEVEESVRAFRERVAGEVLARQLRVGDETGVGDTAAEAAAGTRSHQHDLELDGRPVRISLIQDHS